MSDELDRQLYPEAVLEVRVPLSLPVDSDPFALQAAAAEASEQLEGPAVERHGCTARWEIVTDGPPLLRVPDRRDCGVCGAIGVHEVVVAGDTDAMLERLRAVIGHDDHDDDGVDPLAEIAEAAEGVDTSWAVYRCDAHRDEAPYLAETRLAYVLGLLPSHGLLRVREVKG